MKQARGKAHGAVDVLMLTDAPLQFSPGQLALAALRSALKSVSSLPLLHGGFQHPWRPKKTAVQGFYLPLTPWTCAGSGPPKGLVFMSVLITVTIFSKKLWLMLPSFQKRCLEDAFRRVRAAGLLDFFEVPSLMIQYGRHPSLQGIRPHTDAHSLSAFEVLETCTQDIAS